MTRWWHASDQELLAALSRTQQAVNAAHRDMLGLVAEVVRRGVGAHAGFRSEVQLLHLNITMTAHDVLLHDSDWTCTLADGFPVFHPPPWQPGPPRTNPLHRPDLATAGRRG
jgi:hypothetical protein